MEAISCTPNSCESSTPSPVNQSILRRLCPPASHRISRFAAGSKTGSPLKPAGLLRTLPTPHRLPREKHHQLSLPHVTAFHQHPLHLRRHLVRARPRRREPTIRHLLAALAPFALAG